MSEADIWEEALKETRTRQQPDIPEGAMSYDELEDMWGIGRNGVKKRVRQLRKAGRIGEAWFYKNVDGYNRRVKVFWIKPES